MRLFSRLGRTAHIIGAHDVLSARVGLSAGFDGVWASSLGLSATHGRQDRNQLSWSEVLSASSNIADATDRPILLDGDEGHGSTEIAAQFAFKAARRGIAGISFEDKRFPKQNSLVGCNELSAISGYVATIEACRRAVGALPMAILCRTESLTVGHPVAEAIDRCEAYAEAGADGVIVHSKASTICEIEAFMQAWSGRCPVLIIPTTFGQTSPNVYEQLGISGVIWANQLLRASLSAMTDAARLLFAERSDRSVKFGMASVETVIEHTDPQWRMLLAERA